MSSGFDWAIVLDIGVGLGVLLVGISALRIATALAGTFARLNTTLDEVDRQVAALSKPVVEALDHVGGIAGTADATVARLGAVVGMLEGVAGKVEHVAKLGSDAVAPAMVNAGAALTGVTAGLRRLVTGRRGAVPPDGSSGTAGAAGSNGVDAGIGSRG
ncbi:MAG TPA: hypothetical protein VGC96_01410 [Candidatus Elarobacter sp.]